MRIPLALILLIFSGGANAALITYDFSWTGANGYSLQGSFSYDDAVLEGYRPSPGWLGQSDLTSFTMTGYHNGEILGSFTGLLAGDPAESQFNFNYESESFGTYQLWNVFGSETDTVGFGSGSANQRLYFNGSVGESVILTENTTLVATKVNVVPIPAAVWLFASALAGLGWMRRAQSA